MLLALKLIKLQAEDEELQNKRLLILDAVNLATATGRMRQHIGAIARFFIFICLDTYGSTSLKPAAEEESQH